MKIGFVLDDTLDTPDGVQQYVLTVGTWLTSQGHEVHYLVGESKRSDLDNVHSLARNIKVRFNKNRLSIPMPTNKEKIAALLQKLDLDVIHVQMPYSPLFAGRVIHAAPDKTRVIGTFHIVPASWLQSAGARSLQILARSSQKKFDAVMSVSVAAQDFAKLVFGLESIVVPNAVDIAQFKHTPIMRSVPTIVFLGRLVERKGCGYLLKTLKQLQGTSTGPYEVVIAGKGPLNKKLHDYVARNAINNVRFVGFVSKDAKPELLAGADIAVFPSTGGESFGIVLIEAMAAGSRVVLGGNNVGYSSVLGDHPDLLIDPRDTKAFANRLAHFLEFESARTSAFKWGQEAVKQYDINVVGKNIVKVYEGNYDE